MSSASSDFLTNNSNVETTMKSALLNLLKFLVAKLEPKNCNVVEVQEHTKPTAISSSPTLLNTRNITLMGSRSMLYIPTTHYIRELNKKQFPKIPEGTVDAALVLFKKKSDPSLASNMRPIALCKLLVGKQLSDGRMFVKAELKVTPGYVHYTKSVSFGVDESNAVSLTRSHLQSILDGVIRATASSV